MQQGLALASAAKQIAALAVLLYLPHMTAYGLPPLDLPRVLIWHAAAHIIATVPLEPATRIIRMDPALPAPHRKRLTGVDTEIVEGAVSAQC